jgi:hypothetical protein
MGDSGSRLVMANKRHMVELLGEDDGR